MRRRRSNPDSLELLLDTMCNTFGGIIMIALLIALLSRDASSDAGVNDQRDATQRQIEAARKQAREAEELQRRLQSETSSPEVSTTLAMLTERDELRRKIESAQQSLQSNNTALATVPTPGDPAEAARLAQELQRKTVEAQTLSDRIDRDMQGRQRQLRLPRERATGKKTFYFVMRYGKIYPVHVMREGRRELNAQSLDWRNTPNGESATPRRDSGIDTTAGLPTFARFFNDAVKETYSIHFLVYDDSFPQFLLARQIPMQRGYDVGWEFLPEDRPIIFSSRGEAPPAL